MEKRETPEDADERRYRVLRAMERRESELGSTLKCRCGERFQWEGASDDLDPWLDTHSLHMTDPDT